MVFQHTESTGLFGGNLCLQSGRADRVKLSCAAVNVIGREGRSAKGQEQKKLLKAICSELIHEEVLGEGHSLQTNDEISAEAWKHHLAYDASQKL